MAVKRYISNVFVDNADDLLRLKRGNRRRRAVGLSGSYWTALKALFITQDGSFIVTEDNNNIVTESYTE